MKREEEEGLRNRDVEEGFLNERGEGRVDECRRRKKGYE